MNAKDVKEFKLGELFCELGGLAFAAITAKVDNPEYRTSRLPFSHILRAVLATALINSLKI